MERIKRFIAPALPPLTNSAGPVVTKQIPSYLRLYEERAPVADASAFALQSLPDVLHGFERATGWMLRYLPASETIDPELLWSAPVVTRQGTVLGRLCIELGGQELAASGPQIDLDSAAEMAAALTGMLAEMIRLATEVRHREAELAAGVPVTLERDPARRLAERLQGVLQGCASAIGCQAAALYLLDAATTNLKLRASWGLSLERLLDPPRLLRGALADLEALCGHAVALEDVRLTPTWSIPESFAAGICVPVAGSTTPLGTLWFFSNQPRPFTDQQTGLVEMAAGRLAAELEREVLMIEGGSTAQLRQQLSRAQRWQENQLPRVAPLLPGWSLAGWTSQAQEVGGDFHDWFLRPDDRLCLTIGDGAGEHLPAALSAASLRAALRAYGESLPQPQEVLERANRLLWMGSAGDQAASAGCVLVETGSGVVTFSACGDVALFVLSGPPKPCSRGRCQQGKSRRSGATESCRNQEGTENCSDEVPRCRWLPAASLSLGADPETEYTQQKCELAAGETLVVLTQGARILTDKSAVESLSRGLVAALAADPAATAPRLLEVIRDQFATATASLLTADRTVLVLRRMTR